MSKTSISITGQAKTDISTATVSVAGSRLHSAAPLSLLGGVWYLLTFWKPYWQRAGLILLLMTVYLLFKTYFALQVKSIIDGLQESGPLQNLGATAVLQNLFIITGTLGIGFVIAFGARLLAERMIAQTGVNIINDLRIRIFKHLQTLSQRYYSRTPIGNILARFSSDLADIEKASSAKLRDGLLDLLEILYNFPVLVYLDWRLASLALVLICIMTFFLTKLIPAATHSGYQLKTGEAQIANQVQENLRAQAVIRAFGLEPLMLTQFEQQIHGLEKTSVSTSFARAKVSLAAKASLMACRLILTIAGAIWVMQGGMTLGTLIAFLGLMELVNSSADNLVRNVLPDFIATTSGIQRIAELLDEAPDTVDVAEPVAIPPLQQEIRLEQVSFSYSGQENNLRSINMLLPAGRSAAFVGASGSGKSTLLSLLMRSYEPSAGTIQFDGVDLRRVQRASLQQQMGVVFQETYLFNTTIGENIRMAKPDATDAEVEHAAKLAEIHDLIMNLPQKYDTPVGEAGGRLSGGQRQRIAIARAMIRNPAILLLDEATSALDPGTETAINATLERLSQARTVLSVTHRLSSVVHTDCIFVLKNGELMETGSHHELLSLKGIYAELWQKQTGFEVSNNGRSATVHAAYLRHVALFAALEMNILTTLASHFSPEYIGEGQVVFQQGEVGDKLYLIARGQVEVLVWNAPDTEHNLESMRRIDTMQDGDHFGDMALLQDAPRNATIRTVTACLFLTLPKSEFLKLVQNLPEVRSAVDAQIARNLANRAKQNVLS